MRPAAGMRMNIPKFAARLASAAAIALLVSTAGASNHPPRGLNFYHTHTGEELAVTCWQNGAYVDSALSEINQFLRDFRTGDAYQMDPQLLDILYTVYQKTGSSGRFRTC